MRRDRGPLVWFAACTVVAVIAFAYYLVHRQQIADKRYDRQRDAICKVLASLPGQHPFPTLDRLRAVEARPGHPRECEPQATPRPMPTPGQAVRPVAPFPVPASPEPAASPSPSRTASPRPHPDTIPVAQPDTETLTVAVVCPRQPARPHHPHLLTRNPRMIKPAAAVPHVCSHRGRLRPSVVLRYFGRWYR